MGDLICDDTNYCATAWSCS